MTHTPGPWKTQRFADGTISVLARGAVQWREVSILRRDSAEPTANAQLIAAAPDMLAALQEARAALQRIADLAKNASAADARYIAREALDCFHEKPLPPVGIDRAIAKATGAA